MSKGPVSLRWGLLPVGLAVVLGLWAAWITPSDWSANPRPTPPDEGAHLGIVQYLREHHSLPVFRSQTDNYEAHQPPLYYLTCLPAYAVGRLLGTSPNGLTHAGFFVVRLWSVLLAAVTVWCAWLLGRRIWGEESLLALAPALFLALWPGRFMVLSAVTNDGLAEALCAIVFVLGVDVVRGEYNFRRNLLLGVTLALALLTKSTTLTLVLAAFLAYVMRFGSREALDRDPAAQTKLLKALLTGGACLLVISGWWFVRNQVLYGDPLAARAFEELFSKDRATPAYFLSQGMSGLQYYLFVTFNTALSFWGVFGQANVYHPPAYYLLGGALWLVAIVGGLRGATNRPVAPTPEAPQGKGKKTPPPPAAEPERPWQRRAFALAWIVLIVVVAFFLRFNASFYQAQARYLFSASLPLALLLAQGWWNLGGPRRGYHLVGGSLAVMLIMALWTLTTFPLLAAIRTPPPFFGG